MLARLGHGRPNPSCLLGGLLGKEKYAFLFSTALETGAMLAMMVAYSAPRTAAYRRSAALGCQQLSARHQPD
jgi:hypothetical protein